MDELASYIGYLVLLVACVCLGIWALSLAITAIVHIISFVARIIRRLHC